MPTDELTMQCFWSVYNTVLIWALRDFWHAFSLQSHSIQLLMSLSHLERLAYGKYMHIYMLHKWTMKVCSKRDLPMLHQFLTSLKAAVLTHQHCQWWFHAMASQHCLHVFNISRITLYIEINRIYDMLSPSYHLDEGPTGSLVSLITSCGWHHLTTFSIIVWYAATEIILMFLLDIPKIEYWRPKLFDRFKDWAEVKRGSKLTVLEWLEIVGLCQKMHKKIKQRVFVYG